MRLKYELASEPHFCKVVALTACPRDRGLTEVDRLTRSSNARVGPGSHDPLTTPLRPPYERPLTTPYDPLRPRTPYRGLTEVDRLTKSSNARVGPGSHDPLTTRAGLHDPLTTPYDPLRPPVRPTGA